MFDKCASPGGECRNSYCYCRCFGWAALAVVLLLLGGLVVQLLWNALIPEIFGLGAVSYLQALGLVILGRLLVGGVGCGHGHHYHLKGHGRRHGGGECGDWKHYDAWWDAEGKESFKKFAAAKKEGKEPPLL